MKTRVMGTSREKAGHVKQSSHNGNKIGNVKEGGFHEWLGKSKDAPITTADIQKGLHADSPHAREMANFARNARKWKH